jgi:hypothetical protein
VIASFTKKVNIFLTDANDHNKDPLSLIFEKMNKKRKKSIFLNSTKKSNKINTNANIYINTTEIENQNINLKQNLNSNNTISDINYRYNNIRRRNSSQLPSATNYSFTTKRTKTITPVFKKDEMQKKFELKSLVKNIYNKIENVDINSFNNFTSRSQNKNKTKNKLLISSNLNDILYDNMSSTRTNKIPPIFSNFWINKNKKNKKKNYNAYNYNQILIENKTFHVNKKEGFLDINKNYLTKHNSRDITKKLKTLFAKK